MGKTSRQRGKNNELETARFWGMRRSHFEAHDLTGHPVISVECKARATAIATLVRWISQAINAAPTGKTPVAQFHAMGTRRSHDLVIMRATDLRDLIGVGEAGGGGVYIPTAFLAMERTQVLHTHDREIKKLEVSKWHEGEDRHRQN